MKVVKSWGADGRVVMSRTASDSRDLESQEPVFIEFDGLPVPFFVESIEAKGSRFVVKFQDVDSLEAAEELVGRDATQVEDGEEDEESIVGMKIRDSRSRKVIGEIVAFDDYGGNMLITVETASGEVLLPFHEDLVVSIHDETITLDIPEGLM